MRIVIADDQGIMRQGLRIIVIVFKDSKPMTIVFIETTFCSKPHETLRILKYRGDRSLR